jgi:hypothetical protein
MWLLTSYILAKITEREGAMELNKYTLFDIIFEKLWKKKGLAINDSYEELEGELRYLRRLGIIELDGDIVRVENMERLRKIADRVKSIEEFHDYIENIDELLEDILR